MKNYKILENRPEPTKEQIMQGMDFNKIKANAALAKSVAFKWLIIKGFLGAVVIFGLVFIYKNYNLSSTEKTQAILADTSKIVAPSEKGSSSIYIEAAIDEKLEEAPENKTILNNPIRVSPFTDMQVTNSERADNTVFKSEDNAFEGKASRSDLESLYWKTKQKNKPVTSLEVKKINESLAKINEKLYASKYEVSNKLYMTFLNSLKESNKIDLLSIAQIDTLKWTDKSTYNPPYAKYYHSHPAYDNYPVVNVTYEGAKLFCEWLTEQYNANPKRKFKKVVFRLPSEDEWMLAAKGGDSSAIYPWKGKEIRNKKGQMRANYTREGGDTTGIAGKLNDNADITAPVISYWKNNYGLYNMSGNVEEMIDEKGIAKGGSWNDNSEYLKIESKYKYDGTAQSFVGFRYVVEIIEK